ncbi:MAG: metallophosphoesterase family protein [Ignavibacteriaceae bacterium]
MPYIHPHKKESYTIGVISDTHGILRPEAIKALYGSDLILHAGDIGDPAIIKRLNEIAPTVAIKGNVDTTPALFKFPFSETVEISGYTIFMIHNITDLDFRPEEKNISIVVYGHTHKASIEKRGDVLFFNPGSAGKKRFNFPISTGEIKIKNDEISSRIVKLEL